MKERGAFITLEGTEGAGKTTNFYKLRNKLNEEGYRFVAVREPGGTRISEMVRTILLEPENLDLLPITEILLFEAARAQLTGMVIQPALERGEIVISDRYSDSTTAYQGFARDLPIEIIQTINIFATGGLVPDRTLLYDLSAKAGIKRKFEAVVPDRLEQERIRFHQKVREGYLEMARAEPERWRIIDASQSKDKVWQDTWEIVSSFLAGRNIEGDFQRGKERIG